MEFNENQRYVIDELKRNIYLTAPAGTGKTMVLAERICKILESGIKGNEILCITFTNKACMELKERILLRTMEKSRGITIKTFHSFCLQIIKEMAKKKTDLFFDFTVFDEEDTKEIIKRIRIVKLKNGQIKLLNVGRMQKCINIIKEVRLERNIFTENEIEDLEKAVKIINDNWQLKRKIEDAVRYREKGNYEMDFNLCSYMLHHGGRVTAMYNAILNNARGVDFIDLLTKVKMLFKDEAVVNRYKNRYKYICIDEMQDTGLVEYGIIKKMFENNNILLCGDSFQTIYSFRGSKPKEILEDFESYNPLKISFNENYRSTKNINHASVNFLKNSFESEFKEVYKEGLNTISEELGENVKIIEAENMRDEAERIISELENIKQKEDIRSTCILTRANWINQELSEWLNSLSRGRDYGFALVDEYKFFRRAEVKDIIACLKIILNENDSLSLERVLKRLNTKVSKEVVEEIINDSEYKKNRVKINDYVSSYSEQGEYYTVLIDEFKNSNIVVFDVESTGVDVTEDEIIQIAAIKLDSNGTEIEKFERFIKPNKSVGTSVAVHGFSDSMLKEIGEEKEVVFKDFLKYIEGTVVVGHNVNYDISIFSSELARCNLGSILVKGVYDTLEIYRRFYSNLQNHKLEFLSEEFNTNAKPSHNALDDIRATGEILVKALNNKIIPETEERERLLKAHYNKFNDFRNKIEELRDASYRKRSNEMVEQILQTFNLFGSYNKDSKDNRRENIEKFKTILEILDNKEKSARDSLMDSVQITGLSNGELEELLAEKTGSIRIPIITVHQAKGLEYNNVFISELQDGIFPMKKGEEDEEKRLFYVALTRAKKRIILTYSQKGQNNRIFVKSPFVDKISSN